MKFKLVGSILISGIILVSCNQITDKKSSMTDSGPVPVTTPEKKPITAYESLNIEEKLVYETLLLGLEKPLKLASGAQGVKFVSPSSARLVRLSEKMSMIDGTPGYYILELEAENEFGSNIRKKYNMFIYNDLIGMIAESNVATDSTDNTNADISQINKALSEHWKNLGLD